MLIRWVFIALALACSSSCTPAFAQHSGHHGQGHEQWHEKFYSGLMRKDTKTSCCNLSDCRPTEVRTVGENYEVLVDGEWIIATPDVIQNQSAPDGGSHVCAPKQIGTNKGKLYCVVLPPET